MSAGSLDIAYLKEGFTKTADDLAPVIVSLNGDNSWLLSIPRPAIERQATGKAFYHIISDPWLTHSTSPLPYIVSLALMEVPAIRDGAGVLALIKNIEDAAVEGHIIENTDQQEPTIDLITISHDKDDHMSIETLKTFPSNTPVLTISTGLSKIKAMNHFKDVVAIQPTDMVTEHDEGKPSFLPPWLNIIITSTWLNFTTIWQWQTSGNTDSVKTHEAIVYSPHGLHAKAASHPLLKSISSTSNIRAMLYPLKNSYAFGIQNTWGTEAGLDVYHNLFQARWWIPTHSENPFIYTGLVGTLFIRDEPVSPEAALDKKGWEKEMMPNLKRVGNGEVFVLER